MRRVLFVFLATLLSPIPFPLPLHALTEEEKKSAFLQTRNTADDDVTPKPKKRPSPSPSPKSAPKSSPSTAESTAKPKAKKTPTPEETPKPKTKKTPTSEETPKKKKNPTPEPTPKKKKPNEASPSPSPAPRHHEEEREQQPRIKPFVSPTPTAAPTPTSTPAPEQATTPIPRVTPVATPPPAIPAPTPAPVTIEKSGFEEQSGFEPAPQPPPRRHWWQIFGGGGGDTRQYHYLTRAVRDAIDRAPVMRHRWRYIVVHNSGTRQGNAKAFDYYHRNVRKMPNGLAYHFVIGNGSSSGNGEIEIGSRWTRQINGGHVHSDYLNNIALGICLVGDFNRPPPPTRAQLDALAELIDYLRERVGKIDRKPAIVKAHREINPPQWPTDCPGDRFPYSWLHRRFD